MAIATRTKRGFAGIRCPLCGAPDTLRIDVEDVTVIGCAECDEKISPDDIRDRMAGWTRLLTWLETAPEVEG